MAKYTAIILPEGAQIPEDLQAFVIRADDVIEKIAGCTSQAIITVNTRELQFIVEYRDLIDLDVKAVIGVNGAMYNTVWNTYVSTMERVTLDNLRVIFKERNDDRARLGNEALISPTRAVRAARFDVPQQAGVHKPEDEDNETDFTDDGRA